MPIDSTTHRDQVDVAIVIPFLYMTLDHLEDMKQTMESLNGYDVGIVVCFDGPVPYMKDCLVLFGENVTVLCNERQEGAAF